MQFNLSEDELRKRVDATEISRMRSDEHLVRALNAPFSTPFINANSKTPDSLALRQGQHSPHRTWVPEQLVAGSGELEERFKSVAVPSNSTMIANTGEGEEQS